MGGSYKTVGGTPSVGLPTDYTNILGQFLNTGTFGTAGQADAFKKQQDSQAQLQRQIDAFTKIGNRFGNTTDLLDSLHKKFDAGQVNLQNMITSAQSGTNAPQSGPFAVLNNIFDSNGSFANSIRNQFNLQQNKDLADLKAQFQAGGGSAGTPAAVAEATYKANAAPQFEQALTSMQLSALQPILGQLFGITQQGTPQAQIVHNPGFFQQALGTVGQLAGAAVPFFTNPFGGGGGGNPNMMVTPTPYANYTYNMQP